jgi:tetrahydrodipicolinate N-succinyltransferase
MITDISNVIRSYNFAINDDQIDLVTEAYQELEQAKTDLNEQIEKNMSQRSHINELEKALVFEAVSADLPLMQRERLRTLAENVDADDAKTLTDKLSVLKERFVTESFDTAAALKDISSNAFYLDEQVEVEENTKYVDGNIKKYVDAVSNHVRKK